MSMSVEQGRVFGNDGRVVAVMEPLFDRQGEPNVLVFGKNADVSTGDRRIQKSSNVIPDIPDPASHIYSGGRLVKVVATAFSPVVDFASIDLTNELKIPQLRKTPDPNHYIWSTEFGGLVHERVLQDQDEIAHTAVRVTQEELEGALARQGFINNLATMKKLVAQVQKEALNKDVRRDYADGIPQEDGEWTKVSSVGVTLTTSRLAGLLRFIGKDPLVYKNVGEALIKLRSVNRYIQGRWYKGTQAIYVSSVLIGGRMKKWWRSKIDGFQQKKVDKQRGIAEAERLREIDTLLTQPLDEAWGQQFASRESQQIRRPDGKLCAAFFLEPSENVEILHDFHPGPLPDFSYEKPLVVEPSQQIITPPGIRVLPLYDANFESVSSMVFVTEEELVAYTSMSDMKE